MSDSDSSVSRTRSTTDESSDGGSASAAAVADVAAFTSAGGALVSPPAVSPFVALSPGANASLVEFPRVAHSFGLVMGQVSHGLDRLQTVAEFIRRICAAKNAYAQELLKTSAAYASVGPPTASSTAVSRVSSPNADGSSSSAPSSPAAASAASLPDASLVALSLSEDAMSSSGAIWSDLREQCFEEARQEQEFSSMVAAEVIAPMAAFHAEAEKKRRVLAAHHAALSGQMRALTEQLLQAKIATVRSVQALQLQEAREREVSIAQSDPTALVSAPIPSPASSASKDEKSSTRRTLASVGSFFKSLGKSKPSGGAANGGGPNAARDAEGAPTGMGIGGVESSEELREKAYAAALTYKLAVLSSNARQTQYYRSDLPTLFSELQRIEVARLNCLKHYLGLLAAANLSLVSPNKQRIQSMIQRVADMHSERDCAEFVSTVVGQVGEVVQPNSYVYDLSWKPEQIRSGRMDGDAIAVDAAGDAASAAPSFFTSSLEDQMDLQEQREVGIDLDIPIVLDTLLRGIRDRAGFNRPNLLFLACDRIGVEKLRGQFESAEFDTKPYGLDILANTLKLWLRSLPAPLIPAALYAAAISAIRKDQAASATERVHEDELENNPAAAPLTPDATPSAATSPRDRPRSSSGASLPPTSALPSPQLHLHAMSIFSALPTLNQRVITQLASLLSDIASSTAMVVPEQREKEKEEVAQPQLDLQRWAANMAHCAAIFAPVVLRNNTADTTELLVNASKETRFAAALLIAIAQSSHLSAARTTPTAATAAATAPATPLATRPTVEVADTIVESAPSTPADASVGSASPVYVAAATSTVDFVAEPLDQSDAAEATDDADETTNETTNDTAELTEDSNEADDRIDASATPPAAEADANTDDDASADVSASPPAASDASDGAA